MAYRSLGTSDGQLPKTETLRQAIASGRQLAATSHVVTVFRPATSGSFGLVTEGNYRVNVYENSPLFNALRELLENLVVDGTALAVSPDFTHPGAFTLAVHDATEATWEEKDWGWRRTGCTARSKRASSKNGRSQA